MIKAFEMSGVGEHLGVVEVEVEVGCPGESSRIAECRLWSISSFERFV